MIDQVVLYTLLAIFVGTAIIALGSLPDWIKIREEYRKKLFVLLICEVVTFVLFLAYQIVEDRGRKAPPMTSELLTRHNGWGWHYANNNWYSNFHVYKADGGGYTLEAFTYLITPTKGKVPIREWRSAKPFEIREDGGPIEVHCVEKIYKEWKENVSSAPDAVENGRIKLTLEPFVGLKGRWKTEGTPFGGGVHLTEDTQ